MKGYMQSEIYKQVTMRKVILALLWNILIVNQQLPWKTFWSLYYFFNDSLTFGDLTQNFKAFFLSFEGQTTKKSEKGTNVDLDLPNLNTIKTYTQKSDLKLPNMKTNVSMPNF